MQLKYVKPSFE